jgi:signal transduction histidine kinase
MAPAILIEKGFEAAVRTLVTKLNETNNFKVFLDMFGLECHMEPYFEHALYRSVLEIINNTVCHANATEIDIQIIQNNKDLTIMIEDNGIGFDTEEKLNGKGMGLKSTASRIDNLNGQFFIDSAKGMGTIVTMIIPLTQNKKNGKD